MILKGTEIDPKTGWFEGSPDYSQVLQDILGRVEEEAGYDAIPGGSFLGMAVNFQEITGSHGKIATLLLARVRHDIRDSNYPQGISFTQMIREGKCKGDNWVLPGFLDAIEDQLGGEEHVKGEFVTLHSESHSVDFPR